MENSHLVPNQTKRHLVLGLSGQNKQDQMKNSFGTKAKHITFGTWSVGTKQMRANGIWYAAVNKY